MHVMGSTLLKHVVDGTCNHERFSSPDDVASFINEAFGVEALCGRQLLAAVKNDRAGKPPPKRGTLVCVCVCGWVCTSIRPVPNRTDEPYRTFVPKHSTVRV